MLVLVTDRLYLREYRDEDFEALHAMFSDAETMAFILNKMHVIYAG